MDLQEYYKFSIFSNLAYVTWDSVNTSDSSALTSGSVNHRRLSLEVADRIFNDDQWGVPDFQQNDSSGFAANVFENGDEKVLTIRGTEVDLGGQTYLDLLQADLNDIGTLGVAIHQAVSLFNYIQRLQADESDTQVLQLTLRESVLLDGFPPPTDLPYIAIDSALPLGTPDPTTHYYWLEANYTGQGLGILDEGDQVSITGHSLGGHLAALGIRLFPDLFDQAVTFNAAGFDPPTSHALTDELVQLFGNFTSTPPASSFESISHRIHTLESEDSAPGDDSSLVASIIAGQSPSEEAFIRTEENSHSMDQIMDALAVHTLIETLNPDLNSDQLFNLYDAAWMESGSTEEKLVEALSRLLLQDSTPLQTVEAGVISHGDFGLRSAIHDRVLAILDIVEGSGIVIQDISGMSRQELLQQAEESIAFRYALQELNPFVILGADSLYLPHNDGGRLDLENFDLAYWNDRIDFLELKYELALLDETEMPGGIRDISYVDNAMGLELGIDGPLFDSASDLRVVFGSNDPTGIELIEGSDGSDRIHGGLGSDMLVGGDGKDTLNGGSGDDTLFGSDHLDTLADDGVFDSLNGGPGSDAYYVGDGDALFDSDQQTGPIIHRGEDISGTYTLIAEGYYRNEQAGFDLIRTGSSATLLLEKDGFVTQFRILNFENSEGSFEDGTFGIFLDDGSGNPDPLGSGTIFGTEGDDRFDTYGGGPGPVIGTYANDRILALEGDDIVYPDIGSDVVDAGPGDDFVSAFDSIGVAGRFGDIQLGGPGSDILQGHEADDYLFGGEDGDFLQGRWGNDWMYGGSADDDLAGGIGNDRLFGNEGNDTLDGDLGGYFIASSRDFVPVAAELGSGDDFLSGGGGDDVLSGRAGDDILYGDEGHDELHGNEGNDFLYGGSGNDVLSGDSDQSNYGDDYLNGGAGDDLLLDHQGNDVLDGGAGNDRIYSRQGDDTLIGGAGSDVYYWDPAYGSDRINEAGQLSGDIDTLEIGVPAWDVDLRRDGLDLRIDVAGPGDSLTIENWFKGDAFKVESISLIGAVWDIAAVDAVLRGTGTETFDVFFGTAGDDYFHGNGEEDILYGAAGDDVLYGDSGSDEVFGAAGDDFLSGGSGDDFISGGAGDDYLDAGGDEVQAGMDMLEGGYGSDTYYYRPGSSLNYIVRESGQANDDVDVVRFGAGITLSDLRIGSAGFGEELGGNLVITVVSDEAFDGPTLTISGWYSEEAGQIEMFQFADGSVLTGEEMQNRINAESDGHDFLFGTEGVVVLHGMAGHDEIQGSGETNALYGDEGHDRVQATGSFNELHGGDGDDVLSVQTPLDLFNQTPRSLNLLAGGSGDDELVFAGFALTGFPGSPFPGGAGDPLSPPETPDETVTMADSASILAGGEGDDELSAAGHARVVLTGGRGSDTIELSDDFGEYTILFNGGDGSDCIVQSAAAGIPFELPPWEGPSRHTLSIGGGIGIADIGMRRTGDNLILEFGSGDQIEFVEWFSPDAGDVPMISQLQIINQISSSFDPGSDNPLESAEVILLDVSTLVSMFEIASEGQPADFVWRIADGAGAALLNDWHDHAIGGQIAYDYAISGDANIQSLTGVAGIMANPEFLSAAQEVNLIDTAPVVWNPLPDQAGVEDELFQFAMPVDTFINPFTNGVLEIQITLADGDGLPGWLVFDPDTAVLAGVPANEHVGTYDLVATATNRLGESVAAPFAVAIVNSNDLPQIVQPIPDANGVKGEAIAFGLPLNPFSDEDAGDTLTVEARLGDGNPLPDWLQFDPTSLTFTGTVPVNAPDLLQIDVFAIDREGMAVTDQFELHLESGPGGDEPVVTYGTGGTDRLIGHAGRDAMYGGAGSDLLDGRDGNDVLAGEAGRDRLRGGRGDDVLIGGPGADRLDGGTGNDVYVIGRGHGEDLIRDADGLDTIRFSDGLTPERIRVFRRHDDLVLSTGRNRTRITVDGWFADQDRRIERFEFDDGTVITESRIRLLVQSMAGFGRWESAALNVLEWSADNLALPFLAGPASMDRFWNDVAYPEGHRLV